MTSQEFAQFINQCVLNGHQLTQAIPATIKPDEITDNPELVISLKNFIIASENLAKIIIPVMNDLYNNYFQEGCTCKDIGDGYLANVDNCKIHGFGDEDEEENDGEPGTESEVEPLQITNKEEDEQVNESSLIITGLDYNQGATLIYNALSKMDINQTLVIDTDDRYAPVTKQKVDEYLFDNQLIVNLEGAAERFYPWSDVELK